VFIFDAMVEIYVWIGKKATSGEKRMGLFYAQKYLNEHSRPPHLPICSVIEGGENEAFWNAFSM